MANMKQNYDVLNNYFEEIKNDETLALLTHYIQLQDSDICKTYLNKIKTLYPELDFSNIPSKKKFNENYKVPFENRKEDFTFIDLFAGIGGFRLAMQNNGGQCVFSSEWDSAAKQTYFENYGEIPFGDITKDETKALIPEKFDVLCAGFPCQAFSIAGYRKGFDDVRGTLFFDVADILDKHHPKAFYLENVKNLQGHDNGKTFDKIYRKLTEELHYVVDFKVMNPCEYANVPQNRERIFIVGFDPEQIDLKTYIDGKGKFHFPFPGPVPLTKNIHDIIDDNIDDEKLFYRPGHIYYERLNDAMTRTDTVYQWRRVYVRENKSNMCPTLTANMGEGGHNVPIIRTPLGIRKFTPEECLGFQGFPVDQGYRYPATIAQSKKYKQAGNSVTEPLIEKVAAQIIKILKEQ